MRFWLILATTGSLLAAGCRGLDDGDLTEAPELGAPCPDDAPSLCDDTCVDTSSSVLHCGACDTPCALPPHAKDLACASGGCIFTDCQDGYVDCDGKPENGCEARPSTSPEHCGACGNACATECLDGACNDPIEISAGAAYTCALRASGSVWCWGDDSWGNLGLGTKQPSRSPHKVELPGRAIAVTAGRAVTRQHTCALLEDASVHCWGANGNGQLGTGNKMDSASPLLVGLPETAQLAAGGVHTCAVSKAHQLRCWGSNGNGQLGLGMSAGEELLPQVVLNNVEDVALGADHTCARLLSGTVACWGANASGQIGNGSDAAAPLPDFLPGLAGAMGFALGTAHSCALFPGGSVQCWGEAESGQLGLGTTMDALSPAPLALMGVDFLTVGFASSAAIIDGQLWAWGNNAAAQLGLGDTEPALVPREAQVGPIDRVALGGAHACAIRASGELVCWGENGAGQLGTGDTEPSSSPAPVTFPAESARSTPGEDP